MGQLSVNITAVTLSGRRVLHDIHLDVAAGQFIGLVGPNGAGKTTLLRSILGLIPADGTVTLGGESPTKEGEGTVHGADLRRRCGYVPQRHEVAWDFPISIADCVLGGRTDLIRFRPRAEDREARDRALELADLTDLRSRPIGELSGGQRQRVLVARALARNPELLILDEPFTGVDVPTAEALIGLFRRLANDGTTVLMSSHDLGETVDSTDRIVLLNRTIIDGDPTTPEPWQRAFGVSENSPLLRTVGVIR
ncbi:anchored repeat-type ABC transporter ATP-binding subunit [Corynebacterium uterequi]|uniref:Anchored repeat-type ABC transporter, ATP-binding subunit n=1 Tax=Corynebacterium uterequi TaxID=1072256 RepID=A0A0G3HLR7_9CORY|nr:anchored repeat-type ABC transporter ATP-binding subunit [Corynebacterium uterequi]AKK12072.1 anchored repeat-type ABC transporter, ATP-binding subunit [Corynebacterium uterequi]